jgi:hypothetical protein
MAMPTNTPPTGERLDLSIDDLLAPLPHTDRLGGPGPFVINLSASSAPIALPEKSMAKDAYVFQVQRSDDGRLRYRLRLGPFSTEDEADRVLKSAREIYPSALTATADPDDLRAITARRAKSRLPSKSAPAKSTLPAKETLPAKPIAPQSSAEQKLRTAAEAQPALLESTQTVRPLTQLELEDLQAARWFVIQLSLSEQPVDPDTVPNLDIFTLYRLYSVSGLDQGRILHALRLGFFTEENAARAVANYLTAFYEQTSIQRVSAVERQRFTELPLEPRKDVGAAGKQAAIEITDERFVRERRSGPARK